ncbi:hypothetical protein DBR11_13955 [Pedobacter sp. HMWF019]|uniref:hypothetical protein n=1 Tax=Pedobacter sp. HMWF019 TaxID=2056856 RepID=UPI000D33B158|nr:hypothetical protein [Pedobacter sp. HMWF019]PTS98791.1 hypothetical protein DBR11_13955 [Pedobacter sp. HMWF019]
MIVTCFLSCYRKNSPVLISVIAIPEYVRYKGFDIKIGVIEGLLDVSYQKYTAALSEGHLQGVDKCLSPERYAEIGAGFICRFPFPEGIIVSLYLCINK